jgi:hypothetical protein
MLLALILSVFTFTTATMAEAETFSIVIYTPRDENFRIVPLRTDWTLDPQSKADFEGRDLSTSRQWKIPHVWTGDLTWARGDDGPVPRTFWITDKADGIWNRDMLMVNESFICSAGQMTDIASARLLSRVTRRRISGCIWEANTRGPSLRRMMIWERTGSGVIIT